MLVVNRPLESLVLVLLVFCETRSFSFVESHHLVGLQIRLSSRVESVLFLNLYKDGLVHAWDLRVDIVTPKV